MINFYQRFISPFLHGLSTYLFGNSIGCRYTPTCSEYYKISLQKHGLIKGSIKGILRFLRCNPLFPGGVDLP